MYTYENLADEALRLLVGKNCTNCKYCLRPTTRLVVVGSSVENNKLILSSMYCDYENIVIYRPKSMEMPISKVVDKDTYCDNWNKR